MILNLVIKANDYFFFLIAPRYHTKRALSLKKLGVFKEGGEPLEIDLSPTNLAGSCVFRKRSLAAQYYRPMVNP